jgi:hypothetical protein
MGGRYRGFDSHHLNCAFFLIFLVAYLVIFIFAFLPLSSYHISYLHISYLHISKNAARVNGMHFVSKIFHRIEGEGK